MIPSKKNIRDIETQQIHNGTTFRKQLITTTERHRGDIATMNYAWLTPGMQLEIHAHGDGEEFYLFLEGTGEMLVGDTWIPVEHGDFVTVPVGADHSVRCTTAEKLVFITVRTIQNNQHLH